MVSGVIPPQLVPKHLASIDQHRLMLVRAVEHASELLNMPCEPFDHAPKLPEHASEPSKHASELSKHVSELSKHASKLFVWSLEPSTLEARVCQKDVRSSSNFVEVCPLRFRSSKLVTWRP